ncbi:proP [Symbiodinium natans]|uniref:ProP protein n=1 Tax=Symbiodinium natans TaxID=878477 RepID=A0A812PYX2_9DINO|nr:proP [Symbiodinium natans]
MAHGNLSDFIFLALLGVTVQWLAYPGTLFEDVGPLKAQFKSASPDMTALIKLGGGLLLFLGMIFSGVSWNPVNGKMAGFGAFITMGYSVYSAFKADGDVFIPRPLYAYAGVVLLGALHIFAFPSNPLPEKTTEVKNNHGNFSDLAALSLLGVALSWYFYPEHLFQDLGPLKAQFSSKSPDLTTLMNFVAGLMVIIALMLSGVKWNPINGKMGGFGGFLAAGYTAYSTYAADKEVFVPRLFYAYSLVIFLGALHIFAFPSNPLIKKKKGCGPRGFELLRAIPAEGLHTLLVAAIRRNEGSGPLLQRILRAWVCRLVNQQDSLALRTAIEQRNMEALQTLVSLGGTSAIVAATADEDSAGSRGNECILCACAAAGDVETLHLILDHLRSGGRTIEAMKKAGCRACVRIYWSLLLGNVLEWYEFAVFGFLEPYFQSNFFDGSAITTWLGFASTFLARPFGGVAVGLVGDLFGRKVSTFLSIFGMLIGTVGQGLVPTYQSGPVSGQVGVVLLVSLRLLQGICTGGEIAAVSTYITEVGPKRSLARSMVLIGITCNVGFLLAQFASYLTLEALGEEAMASWGWRIPFLCALAPGLVATAGRRCIPESREFEEARERSLAAPGEAGPTAKIRALLRGHRAALLVGIFSVAAIAVVQYGALAWCYVLLKGRGASSTSLITAGVVARCLAMILAPLIGWLADAKGVAWVQLMGAVVMAAAGLPLFVAMRLRADDDAAVVGFYGLGYGIFLATTGMVYFLYVVELFPVEIRNVGVGMSYNIGFCIFGGFSPMIFEASHAVASWAPGCMLSLAGCITAATVLLSLRLEKHGLLRLAHIRQDPYFQCQSSRKCEEQPAEAARPVVEDPVEVKAAGQFQAIV